MALGKFDTRGRNIPGQLDSNRLSIFVLPFTPPHLPLFSDNVVTKKVVYFGPIWARLRLWRMKEKEEESPQPNPGCSFYKCLEWALLGPHWL